MKEELPENNGIMEKEVSEPKPGALGTADISEDTEYSHLVETENTFWNVFPCGIALTVPTLQGVH